MYQIPLAQVPNQAISFNASGAYWQVRIYQSVRFMCMDVAKNGVTIATGVRCFGGTKILQYPYMYSPAFGNFVFDSDADWTNFGLSCNLYHLDQIELQQLETVMLS